jgi:membrane-bound lytic murein transglycosylase F
VNEPHGIDYELAKGYAEHIGVNLHMYVADSFWQIFPEVTNGKAHAGAAGLAVTGPREELVDFSPAYQTVRPEVIYRRGSRKPDELADMLNGRIEIQAESAYVGLFEEAREQLPELVWGEDRDASVEDLVRRVASGEIDYTVVNSNLFALLQQSYPDAREAFPIGPETTIAWALPKTTDTSLRESVSAYFAELHSTGELNEILDRYYFSTSKEFDYVGSRSFVRHFNARLPEFRDYFIAAAERTRVDWRLLAAMAYQESHWDADAVSVTGVRGVMMLTSGTANMLGVEDRTDPEQSIHGGADYFVRVTKKIPARINDPDRTWLAVAAYNVGFGHLEDARIITEIQGGNPDSWAEVRDRLPLLSDPTWFERVTRGYARGEEPVTYVDNVRRYYDILRWMTAGDSGGAADVEIVAEASTQ